MAGKFYKLYIISFLLLNNENTYEILIIFNIYIIIVLNYSLLKEPF